MAQQDQYTMERTINFPNMVARIHRPVLTDHEKAVRMQAIYRQAERLLKKVK